MKDKKYVVNISKQVHQMLKALTAKKGIKLGFWVSEKLREAAEQERAK